MIVETTIHMHKNMLEMLNSGAARTGRSRTFIIKILMQRVMDDNNKMLKPCSMIKYQARDEKDNWYRIHLVLNEYEYEYCLDMRKFYKMSVSFILAFAVRRFLDEVVNELIDGSNNTDNCFYQNYILIKKIEVHYFFMPSYLDRRS
jgi:hypothetical protein